MVKTNLMIMIFLVFLSSGCRNEFEKNAVTEDSIKLKVKIIAVGDSLTAGYGLDGRESYPALLEQKLKSSGFEAEVINAGVSAETSSGTLARLEWIISLQPDIVILEIGANDGLRSTDPEIIEQNIREILQRLEGKRIVTLLAGMKMVWNLGPVYVHRFNAIYPKLAHEFDVVFLPFFLENVAMESGLNLRDGLHPNAEGYVVITEKIYPFVVEAIEKWKQI